MDILKGFDEKIEGLNEEIKVMKSKKESAPTGSNDRQEFTRLLKNLTNRRNTAQRERNAYIHNIKEKGKEREKGILLGIQAQQKAEEKRKQLDKEKDTQTEQIPHEYKPANKKELKMSKLESVDINPVSLSESGTQTQDRPQANTRPLKVSRQVSTQTEPQQTLTIPHEYSPAPKKEVLQSALPSISNLINILNPQSTPGPLPNFVKYQAPPRLTAPAKKKVKRKRKSKASGCVEKLRKKGYTVKKS